MVLSVQIVNIGITGSQQKLLGWGGGGGLNNPKNFTWLPGFKYCCFCKLGTSKLMKIWLIHILRVDY